MKLVDSTFLIDILNKDPGAMKKAEDLKNTNLFFTDLNIYEVALGIHNLDRSKEIKALIIFKELIQNLDYLPLTNKSSFKAAKIKANLMRKGITIDDIDCLIAAIGIENGINIIITRNIKHFSVIEKIKVESY